MLYLATLNGSVHEHYKKQAEIAMKKIVITILVLFAFAWTPVVSAEQSPESIVTCGSMLKAYEVHSIAISSSVNTDECAFSYPCNPCIESLESQGCKIIDSKQSHLVMDVGSGDQIGIVLSYMLSCKTP